MSIDPAWRLLAKKSIANHFKTRLNGMYLEGSHHWLANETGYELRMHGPSATELQANDCYINVDINILIKAMLEDDVYLIDKMIDTVLAAFTEVIGLYKFDGVETGAWGCLLLKSDRAIRHLPLIDTTLGVGQATVQCHYEANVSGDSVIVLQDGVGQDYFLMHDTVTHQVKKFWVANGDLQSETL